MNQIDHYQIVEKIGEGGMGEVYKGVDVMLEREVAIKLLRPELSNRDDVVQRFRSEAVALGRLSHSNIAAVYSFGRFHDQYYMALEFVHGETLDTLIKQKGPLPWREAVHYTIAVLEGLAHAHRFNIVHRDIKPANIIITPNNAPKILDFGIARILEKARLTRIGHLVGTLEYVSPEQLQGKDTDARADIYSTGMVLYEMLTGHLPFEKNTEYDLIKSQIEEKPKSPKTLSGDIPSELDKLVLKALEKTPDKRFANADEFSQSLGRVVSLSEASPVKTPFWSLDNRLISFCKDYPIPVLFILLLCSGSSYLFWKINPSGQPPALADDLSGAPPAEQSITSVDTEATAAVEPIPQPARETPQQPSKNHPLPPPFLIPIKPLVTEEPPAKTAATVDKPITKTVDVKKSLEKRRAPIKKRVRTKKILPSDPDLGGIGRHFYDQ